MPLQRCDRWPQRGTKKIGVLGEVEPLPPLKKGDKVKLIDFTGQIQHSRIGVVVSTRCNDGRYEVRFKKLKTNNPFRSLVEDKMTKLYYREELVSDADEAPQNVREILCA